MLKVTSIKQFLLLAIIGLVVISGTITLVANYEETQEQVEELFDAELAQMARVLQSILISQLKRTNLESLKQALVYEDFSAAEELEGEEDHHHEYTDLGHKYEKKLAFQVWHDDGRMLIHTKSAEGYKFRRMDAGFHVLKGEGSNWRTFTLHDTQLKAWIQVAQRADVRSELVGEIALQSIWPSLVLIVLLIIGIGWVVKRALTPLQDVSEQLEKRSADNLSTLSDNQYPSELKLLVAAINGLFTRLQRAMERERRFTADAAHELRTPLAATKVHLENALVAIKNDTPAPDEAQKNVWKEGKQTPPSSTPQSPLQSALQPSQLPVQQMQSLAADCIIKALTGLQRLIHLVEQLLQLSRLEQENQQLEKQNILLNDIVSAEVDAIHHYAAGKNVSVMIDNQASVSIKANSSMLHILIRNLIDNAVRYSPQDGIVNVRLSNNELIVEDQGPGIPVELRDQIFERFFRGKSSRESGSGLGLSIVQEIAQLHGMQIELSDAAGEKSGLRVQVLMS